MNPAIAVIYGNFLLAILTVPSGVTALPLMLPLDWFSVAFLGVIQIGISYILFIRGVTGGTRPLDASIIGFIEPLLNPVWVFLFIGEKPSTWAVLGGVIIISTVVSHTFVQYRNTSRP
jgi:drug/metabolite transporter (DMT)-like permease